MSARHSALHRWLMVSWSPTSATLSKRINIESYVLDQTKIRCQWLHLSSCVQQASAAALCSWAACGVARAPSREATSRSSSTISTRTMPDVHVPPTSHRAALHWQMNSFTDAGF